MDREGAGVGGRVRGWGVSMRPPGKGGGRGEGRW